MTDTTPGPTIGWNDFGGRRAYYDGQKWTDEHGNVMAAKADPTPQSPPTGQQPPSQPVGRPSVASGPSWPMPLGLIAIVIGVMVFFVPPYSSDTGYGSSVVNFPTMFLQYGIALALVLGGILFVCTSAIVDAIFARR